MLSLEELHPLLQLLQRTLDAGGAIERRHGVWVLVDARRREQCSGACLEHLLLELTLLEPK